MSGANAMRAGAAYIELQARADRLMSDVQRAARQAGQAAGATISRTMSQRMASAGSSMSAAGGAMTRSLSLPLAAVGVSVIKLGADFEYQMRRVKNISQATGSDFDMMNKQAKDLGASTRYSATQAAEGMEYLAMAGFKPKEIYAALPAVLNGAAAANMDLGMSANIVSNIMTGYGLKASEASRATDLLIKATQNGNVDVEMLGESFKYGGTMAKMAGLSVEEAAATFTMMGNAGLQGSIGGTAMGAALRSMMKPSKFAKKEMQALGLTFTDSAGKIKPLSKIIDDVGKSSITNEQFLRIFGTEGGRAMNILAEQGSGALVKLTKTIEDSAGTTDRFAADMDTTAKQGVIGFTSALEGLAIAISESGVLDGFNAIVRKATEFVRKLTETKPEILKWGFTIGLMVVAVGPLLKVFGMLFGWMAKIGPAVRIVKTAMMGLNLAFLSSPVFWVVAAIVALGVAVVVAYKKFAPFRRVVDSVFAALRRGFDTVMVALQPVFAAVRQVVAQVVESARQMWVKVQPFLALLGGLFRQVFGLILVQVQTFIAGATWIWDRWGSNIMGMVQAAWVVIRSVIVAALGIIRGTIQVVTGLITGDWSAVWNGIKTIISAVWGGIKGVVTGALAYLKNSMSIAWDVISSAASAAWNGIWSMIKGVAGFIVGLFLRWTLPGIIISHWQSIKTGTVRKASEMLAYVKGLPKRIIGYFGNFGSMLFGKGQNLIQGLWNGIKSMGGWLASKLTSFAKSAIPGPIAKALGIHSPSRFMRDHIGKWIPAGILDGIALGKQAIERVMAKLVPAPTMPDIDPLSAPLVLSESFVPPKLRVPELSGTANGGGAPVASQARSMGDVNVYAETNASASDIGREVAWAMRTTAR